jgi:uncharacterized protein (TIGR02594 family)
MTKPKWLEIAESDMGLEEAPGSTDNPHVVQMYADAGHPEVKHDATAWCAAAVGSWLKRSSYKPSGSLMARSYLTWGAKLDQPKIGAVAVLWRNSPNSSEGHVGFVVDAGQDFIKLLGGNQGSLGQVSIETFPMSRVLGFRWPAEETFGPIAAVKSRSIGDRIMTDISSLEAFLPTIELYAPTVGRLIGGPAGAIGGQIAAVGIHALATAFGIEPTTEAVAAHMDATPILKAAEGLRTAEELVVGSMPKTQLPAAVEPHMTLQDETVKVFHDAGVTNPTIVMIGSLVVTALSGWLVNKGWMSSDMSIAAVGLIGGAISSASAIYHSVASNQNTRALAASK